TICNALELLLITWKILRIYLQSWKLVDIAILFDIVIRVTTVKATYYQCTLGPKYYDDSKKDEAEGSAALKLNTNRAHTILYCSKY
ncbi:Protein of unknown function, partial [Gryllus bimaculatus]